MLEGRPDNRVARRRARRKVSLHGINRALIQKELAGSRGFIDRRLRLRINTREANLFDDPVKDHRAIEELNL